MKPQYNEELDLFAFNTPTGLTMFYRPELEEEKDQPSLVFMCRADPNRAQDDQQCDGLVRIVPTLRLKYRFSSHQLAHWRQLDRDVQKFVLSMIQR